MIIDAHQHFWRYNSEEFGWIGDDMAGIRKNFLPVHLKKAIDSCGVDGVISVQARQSLEETDWLLNLAAANDFILGVTGWLPLVEDNAGEYLEKYSDYEKLKALRHVIQDEEDDNFISRDDFNRGVSLLKNHKLIYEILIFEKHLPQTIEFVDRHPNQIFVLDHVAKPRIRDHLMEPWGQNIRELGRRDNVYCKVSGMVTEADIRQWSPEQLQKYFNVVLEAFGPGRLMFGSDWPVCLSATGYCGWLDVVKGFIEGLSANEQHLILGNNAEQLYC